MTSRSSCIHLTHIVCRVLGLLGLLVLLGPPVVARGAPSPGTEGAGTGDTEIAAAVARGCAWLRSVQDRDGAWRDRQLPLNAIGLTGLCLIALRGDGYSKSIEASDRAIAYLTSTDPRSVADASLCARGLLAALAARAELRLTDERVLLLEARLRAAVDLILRWQLGAGGDERLAGCWGYPHGEGDAVNTGLACVALCDADAAGCLVPQDAWARCADGLGLLYCAADQNDGLGARGRRKPGGVRSSGALFRYSLSASTPDCTRGPTLAVTSALECCRPHLIADAEGSARARRLSSAGAASIVATCRRGVALSGSHVFFWLWQLREWQDRFPLEEMEQTNWYLSGSDALLRSQVKTGAWDGGDVSSSAMALIFLARRSEASRATSGPTTPK